MRGYRTACLLVLLLALSTAAAAADKTPKQAFIERTLVIAPLKVGDFVLEGSRYDPANKFAGQLPYQYCHCRSATMYAPNSRLVVACAATQSQMFLVFTARSVMRRNHATAANISAGCESPA